jgi:diaminopimelate epimerase
MLQFTKMNGAGNDFVMVDNRSLQLSLDSATIARLCDRHRGIGADGLISVEPAQADADFRMRYYNADGGEAEMCGNGARCFGRFAARLTGRTDAVSFETLAGIITAQLRGNHVQIAMSQPHSLLLHQPLSVSGTDLEVHSLNTGVPHAVVWVDDLQNVDVRSLGAGLRYHPHFAPKGTNANFAQKIGPQQIAIRTYERGVEDETLACGTGMVACALTLQQLSGCKSPIQVTVRGGDTLEVAFERDGEDYRNVRLTGPADFVFEGQASLHP